MYFSQFLVSLPNRGEGSVNKLRLVRWTFNLEAPSSIPALTASWTYSQQSRVQLLEHAYKLPTSLPSAVGILNLVGHNEKYWFTRNCVTPIKAVFFTLDHNK